MKLSFKVIIVEAVIRYPTFSYKPKVPTRRDWLWRKKVILINNPYGNKLPDSVKKKIANNIAETQFIEDIHWVNMSPFMDLRLREKGWLCYLDIDEHVYIIYPLDRSSVVDEYTITI